MRVVVLGYKTRHRLGAVIEQQPLLLTMSQPNFDTPELRNADPKRKVFYDQLTRQSIMRKDQRELYKKRADFDDVAYPSIVEVCLVACLVESHF